MEYPDPVNFHDRRKLSAGSYRVSVTHYLNIIVESDGEFNEADLASKALAVGYIGHLAITEQP
jgi:hypothetical protein